LPQNTLTYLLVVRKGNYGKMSDLKLELSLVAQVMYLQYGDVNPGDEEKVARYERKLEEWKRDVVDKAPIPGLGQRTKEEMSNDMWQCENVTIFSYSRMGTRARMPSNIS
jgi:hypothetical protein